MCIVTSFDTLPLDVDFGHLLTGYNFSDCHRRGGGDGKDDRKTTRTTEEGEDAEENGSRHGYGSKLANILSKGLCILGLNFKQ